MPGERRLSQCATPSAAAADPCSSGSDRRRADSAASGCRAGRPDRCDRARSPPPAAAPSSSALPAPREQAGAVVLADQRGRRRVVVVEQPDALDAVHVLALRRGAPGACCTACAGRARRSGPSPPQQHPLALAARQARTRAVSGAAADPAAARREQLPVVHVRRGRQNQYSRVACRDERQQRTAAAIASRLSRAGAWRFTLSF